ncbi:MAG: D-TA family PLP-dependent enzyme [Acidimicrobiia bacterium]|nr:D-TA family PLP-dependent enzyme [Acidimicrobiia bacterium]
MSPGPFDPAIFDHLIDATRDLPTPLLVIDDTVVAANILRLAEVGEEHGVDVRPHIKTHKSSLLSRRQLDAGAVGLACATLSEALGLGEAGVSTEIMVAAPVFLDRPKTELLRRVAALHDRVLLAADSPEGTRVLGGATGFDNVAVMIEVDSGNDRTGVAPEDAGDLASTIEVPIAGIFTHGGHSYGPGKASAAADDEVRALSTALDGMPDPDGLIVSAGSTPTATLAGRDPVTELRVGTSVFGDRQQTMMGSIEPDQVGTAVVTTIIHAAPDKLVLDAGAKTVTKDRAEWLDGYGALPAEPNSTIIRLYDNHGVVSRDETRSGLKVGERVVLIPNHICPVVNCFDEMHLVDEDGADTAIPVDLRGNLA